MSKGNNEITELLMQTMVRRSRQDVIKRQEAGEEIRIAGKLIKFPKRTLENFTYNFEESYAGLYIGLAEKVDELNLAPYNIKAFKKKQNKTDKNEIQRNKALVALQKALYFKRFESSLTAFQNTVTNQFEFQTKFYKILIEQEKLLDGKNFRKMLLTAQAEDDGEDSLVTILDSLESVTIKDYNIDQLTAQIEADIRVLQRILDGLTQIQNPRTSGEDTDCKLIAFKNLLLNLKGEKILVFSYFKDTANYLYQELKRDTKWQEAMQNPKLDIITGDTSGKQRELKVKHFAPKANTESQEERDAIAKEDPIDILICTDVLSEGQNLQDAGILVNYDLHWNPVRMIQRAGRIDRLGTDYEKLYIYNCFPEEGLENLLGLVERLQRRIADIDRNVGLDASVLGEEISNKSLEELRRLKQADSEAEKQAILSELEQISDLISLDEMRLPLLEFIQQVGQELVEEIPLGIHSTRHFRIPDPNFSEGGIFLAFKAGDRDFWHFYPRRNEFITTEPDQVITDKRKIFNWLKCQQSDFPPPESLPPVEFNNAIFSIVEGVTRNLLESFKRETTSRRFRPRLTGVLLNIREKLIQPTLWEQLEPEEVEVKDRVLEVITESSSEISNYNKEIKSIWDECKRNDDIRTLLTLLDELFIENELYQDIEIQTDESIHKMIKAEDLQLVCYEWFYPE